jgi:predicted O-methyltransferase YrrM
VHIGLALYCGRLSHLFLREEFGMIPLSSALAAQIDELERLGKTRDDAWQISREQGELQAAIAVAAQAKLILEIGTSYGFSGLWWAAALGVTGGHLHTIDISEKKFASSKATFAAAGVAGLVTNHLGDAHTVLAGIPGAIDLVFIDADKPSCQAYFGLVWPRVRVGGGVLTDNVISHEKELAAFVRGVKARADAQSVTIGTRSGVEWTVKVR